MATGVPGVLEYSAGPESVWCSLNGQGLVRVEIRRSDQEAILFPPAQAMELAKVLDEMATAAGNGYRIVEEHG